MRVERHLQEPWPLSAVELMSDGDKYFVRKTVHRDLGVEALRQQAIYDVAEGFTVPKVLNVAEEGNQTVIMMEYVKPTRDTTVADGSVIDKFHDATEQLVGSGLFPSYSLGDLEQDLNTARQYGDLPAEVNAEFFESIFDNQTVLHGDWALDQILVHDGQPAIIDFARSQVGPRILDQGHMLRFETNGEYKTCDDPQLLKACIVADVQRMAWFDLCKQNYIDYSYEKEMQAGIEGINVALGRLGVR